MKFYQVKAENYSGGSTQWVPAKEVAKYVKQLLKSNFPNVKFSVRKESGGGSCVRVSWPAGSLGTNRQEARNKVDSVIGFLHGEGFDGMIDMRFYRDHYILKSGEIVYAGTEGTQGSMGVYAAEKREMPKGARKVSLSNSFIFAQEEYA